MKYVTNVELGKKVILDKYPEFKNSTFAGDNSGWDNYAIKVDNEYIFRFPKRDSAYRTIMMENEVLKELNKVLPDNIKVPNYLYINLDTDYPFVGYKMINGEFLSDELYDSMSKEEKKNFINNMMTFINILHSLDINKFNLDEVDSYENYKMRYEEFKEKCYKYFDKDLIEKTDSLFNNYFNDKKMHEFEKVIIHGDLSTDHIIITDDGIGIIDFGDTRVFDKAYDYQWLYLLDKNEINNIIDNYSIDRIKFYTSIIPYYGIVYALEINDKEMLEKNIKQLRGN